jgi:hypothetical protein
MATRAAVALMGESGPEAGVPLTGRQGIGLSTQIQGESALHHTFVTRWLQAGGDIYRLSRILGHSSVAGHRGDIHAHMLKETSWRRANRSRFPCHREGLAVSRRPRRYAIASESGREGGVLIVR